MLNLLRSGSYRVRAALTVGIVLVSAAVFLACGVGSAANSGSTVGNGASGTGGQTSATSKHFKVGDQVKVGSTYIVTINSVARNSGNDIDQPKAGDNYLVVDVTVKNVSSQEQDLSSILQFTLKDASGQKYDETFISNATAPDGKIEPGDQVRGQLPYEVPTAQKTFTLAFESDITSSGETIWDLAA